jgi:hypothetical protein
MRSWRVAARSWVVLRSGGGRGIGKVGWLSAQLTRVVLWAVSGSGRNGVQATRDGQQLAPSTIGKYIYHHRLVVEYETILLQEHDKLCSQIEHAEVRRYQIVDELSTRRTTTLHRAMLPPAQKRKATPYAHKDHLNITTPSSPSYDSPQYSPTRTHITVSSSSSSDDSQSSSSSDVTDETGDDTSTVTTKILSLHSCF